MKRWSIVAASWTRTAHRPQGERGLRGPARRAFRGARSQGHSEGLSIRGRMELHLYPDGSEGWCLTWKEPLIDANGSIRGLAGISRDAPAPIEIGAGFEGAFGDAGLHRGSSRSAVAHSRTRCASGPFPVPVRSKNSNSVRPFCGPISVASRALGGRATVYAIQNAPLSELAVECGYADQAAFTRQFRKSVGLTPGAYRLATARGRERGPRGLGLSSDDPPNRDARSARDAGRPDPSNLKTSRFDASRARQQEV